ncbi:MAG: hypothetical protein ACE5JG_07895, partial [Planctomycetota bacterium]
HRFHPVCACMVAAALLLGATAARAPAKASRAAALPRLVPVVAFSVRPARIRTIADVDLLADGRIAVLDFDARRVAIFSSRGRFERFLRPPPGIAPGETLLPRLAALPGGGLILVDDEGDRFLFYDRRLDPRAVVPFGLELTGTNGFVRHPSGELYLVASSQRDGRILHRFDPLGRHLDSYVGAAELPFPQRSVYNSGQITVDPADGTLWLTRLLPYEILHVDPRGELLGRIARGALAGPPPPGAQPAGADARPLRVNFASSAKIAVIGDFVVNSYVLESGKQLADVFTRDGRLVAAELTMESPLAFTKRVSGGVFVRQINGSVPRVELWRERPRGARASL